MATSVSAAQANSTRRWLAVGVGVLAVLLVVGLGMPIIAGVPVQSVFGGGSVGLLLALALPTYLAGALSALSPCCLPILPAYFSFTFGAQRRRVVAMSIAFFLGLATTMVVLGASLTAISQVIFPYRKAVSQVGGVLIIGFGVLSMLGKGFSGLTLRDRPSATLGGTYLYGLTFSFGWTACVGPILGAVLTAVATTGLSVLSGATLTFIYALGIATPLTLIAVFFGRAGNGTRVGNVLRGRGFGLRIAGRTLHLHTTSLLSGVMLVAVGALLASGQLYWLSQRWAGGIGGQIALALESWIARVFQLGW